MTEPTGRAKGGAARAASLTPERRKEIAMAAVAARKEKSMLPKLIKKGEDLNLAGILIPCAVIEGPNGEPLRVLSESGITNALLGSRSGASKRLKKKSEDNGAPLPIFLAPSQLKPFIDNDLANGPLKVIEYVDGGRVMSAFNAEVLPAVCEIWLKAREAGALQTQQMQKAQQAEMLTRGLARVGIVALVDEATGFQKDRAKDALSKILEAFVAKELQPYVRTFPHSFYEEMFRLRGLAYPPENPKFRPQYFGLLTSDIVYERLAPGLLEELKRQAAKDEKKSHLHRRLTQEVGHPKLREHLASVTTVMKLSSDYPDFIAKLNRIHPRFGQTYMLDLDQTDR